MLISLFFSIFYCIFEKNSSKHKPTYKISDAKPEIQSIQWMLCKYCILVNSVFYIFFLCYQQARPNNIALVHSFIRRNTPKKVDPEVSDQMKGYSVH